MSSRAQVIGALFRKELRSFLGNPTGYVFLTLFIVASASAAFLTDTFFSRNLADLATLNQWMPAILMFFVPAVTMGLWADERRSGTDELLLTLPVRDGEVVLGKFLGALGVYTVGLVFSLANVAMLAYLGDPDTGLMFSTYLGYWLMGALFVAVGMVGSMFTGNTTVAFILGALGCAGLVVAGMAPWASALVGLVLLAALGALKLSVLLGRGAAIGALLGAAAGLALWLGGFPWFTDIFAALSAPAHFASFGEGLLRVGDILYFVGGIVVALYLCTILISRRHW
jgi:ABC-type transport system involved in multi-copper enzyme maturation permease subunit